MIYILDDWINFWNDYNNISLNKIHKTSIKAFKTTIYPDYSRTVAALTIEDKDKIIEHNGEVYGHILQKDYFKGSRRINIKSHKNDKVVYSAYMISATIGLFPINNEMIIEVFVDKKAPMFLTCRDYQGWAILFMPCVLDDIGDYGDYEELPKERKMSLKGWI